MKVLKRSDWTAQYPSSSVGTEDMEGPPFFRAHEVKGLSIFTPDEPALFVELNPFSYFETQRKKDYSLRGFGDVQYNLAVAPNVEGVWCLRGLCNKSPSHTNKVLNNHFVSVLVLLGSEEPPTDLLLQNLTACRDFVLSRYPNATAVRASLPFNYEWDLRKNTPEKITLPDSYSQDTGVHVFDLIENLAYWGYYKGRNDGVYGPVTTNAVALLQADLKDGNMYRSRITGNYDHLTREAFNMYLKSLG